MGEKYRKMIRPGGHMIWTGLPLGACSCPGVHGLRSLPRLNWKEMERWRDLSSNGSYRLTVTCVPLH